MALDELVRFTEDEGNDVRAVRERLARTIGPHPWFTSDEQALSHIHQLLCEGVLAQ